MRMLTWTLLAGLLVGCDSTPAGDVVPEDVVDEAPMGVTDTQANTPLAPDTAQDTVQVDVPEPIPCEFPTQDIDCETQFTTVTYLCYYYTLSHEGANQCNTGCAAGESCYLCPNGEECDQDTWLCIDGSPAYKGIPDEWLYVDKCFGDPDSACGTQGACDGTKLGGNGMGPSYEDCACCPGNPGYPSTSEYCDYFVNPPGLGCEWAGCPGQVGMRQSWTGDWNRCYVIMDTMGKCGAYLLSLPDPTLPWRHCYPEICD